MSPNNARRIEELQALIEGEWALIDRCPMFFREGRRNIARWEAEREKLVNDSPLLNWRSSHVY